MLAAVIFDFDGLIIDTETPAFESTSRVFADHDVVLDREWWLSIIGVADHPHWTEVLADQLGRALDDPEAVIAARNEVKNAATRANPVQPGVVELLDECAEAGLPVAIASSSSEAWVAGHLEERGLIDRFSFLATRDKVQAGKPAPDLYALAVERLGVDPARCVGLDDSPAGVTSAKQAGLAAVGVPVGMTASLDFSHADLVVGSVAELELATLGGLVGARR